MANNKVITILVEANSAGLAEVWKFLETMSGLLISATIRDEAEDPLFPDRLVSHGWFVKNWLLSSMEAPQVTALHMTPKQIRDALEGVGRIPDIPQHLEDQLRFRIEQIKDGVLPFK